MKRFSLLDASSTSALSGQMDQKSRKNEAWMMWKITEAVKTRPAIQWYVTQLNWTPTFGRKAVTRSVNMAAAMIQWNRRAASEWRGTRAGTLAATSGDVPPANASAFA